MRCAEGLRERLRQRDRTRHRKESSEIDPAGAVRHFIAHRRLGKRVDAQQRERPVRKARQPHARLDDGRRAMNPCLSPKARVDALGQRAVHADELVRRAAGHERGRQLKGAAGAVIREIDADDHRDPERNADERQPELSRMALQEAPA